MKQVQSRNKFGSSRLYIGLYGDLAVETGFGLIPNNEDLLTQRFNVRIPGHRQKVGMSGFFQQLLG